jgi:Fe-S cluster biogenesis protein NfuA
MEAARARIESILGQIRPLLQADGGDIELLDATPRGATVRLHGKCAGCPSSSLTMHLGLEMVIKEAIPEFEELIVV